MIATLLLALAVSASEPRASAVGHATATIVEAQRIRLQDQMIERGTAVEPRVQRTRLVRRGQDGLPGEVRLLEFQ